MGYQIKKIESFDPAMESDFKELYFKCKPLHLQSVERLYALYQATRYLINNPVEGDIVECGVFKGASIVLMAEILKRAGSLDRKFYLYDTFEGWPIQEADDQFLSSNAARTKSVWGRKNVPCIEEVQKNVWQTQYPKENFIFIKGRVEEALPSNSPGKIALLRLDTDGYSSTRHELIHLYPKLSAGGILIIDDYGHWNGAKKACDEFFSTQSAPPLLNRIDYTGRIGVKFTKET